VYVGTKFTVFSELLRCPSAGEHPEWDHSASAVVGFYCGIQICLLSIASRRYVVRLGLFNTSRTSVRIPCFVGFSIPTRLHVSVFAEALHPAQTLNSRVTITSAEGFTIFLTFRDGGLQCEMRVGKEPMLFARDCVSWALSIDAVVLTLSYQLETVPVSIRQAYCCLLFSLWRHPWLNRFLDVTRRRESLSIDW
jgi:phosphatidylserine synthase